MPNIFQIARKSNNLGKIIEYSWSTPAMISTPAPTPPCGNIGQACCNGNIPCTQIDGDGKLSGLVCSNKKCVCPTDTTWDCRYWQCSRNAEAKSSCNGYTCDGNNKAICPNTCKELTSLGKNLCGGCVGGPADVPQSHPCKLDTDCCASNHRCSEDKICIWWCNPYDPTNKAYAYGENCGGVPVGLPASLNKCCLMTVPEQDENGKKYIYANKPTHLSCSKDSVCSCPPGYTISPQEQGINKYDRICIKNT